MLELHIDMREIMGFAKALEQAPGMVAEEQRLAMQKSLDVLEQTIVPRTPVGVSGNLRGSIATEIRGTPANLQGGEGCGAAEPIMVQIWEGLPERVFNRLAKAG